MKKLTNVSPFILLLVPVFVMMLLTFTTSINSNQDQDKIVAKKADISQSVNKVNISYLK